jgi:hypothetical protein
MIEIYAACAAAALLDNLGTLVGSMPAELNSVLALTRGMR